MKLEVKKVDTLKRELKFEIPKDRIKKTLDEVYQEIGKVAKVRGFRPGKVPRHILEGSHGAFAQEEMIKKIIPEVYHEVLHQEKIAPIDMPEIHDVNLKEGVLTFVAKLEVRPEVNVKDYKGIKVNRKSAKVTDDEINKTLEFLKKGRGEDKEVTVDDDFARSIGYPNLADFKESLTRQMEMDKDRQNRIDVENQIVEKLIETTKLVVPQAFVKKHMEHRIHEAKQRLKSQGISDEDMKKREEDLKKELASIVERDVKIYLIFQAIAGVEGIHAHNNESLPAKVMEFLLKEAKWEEAKNN